MSSDNDKLPKKQLEASGGGTGGRRKTAIGTEDSGSAPQPLPRIHPEFETLRAIVVEKHPLISFGLKKVLSHLVSVIADASDPVQGWEMARRLRTEIIVTELNFDDESAIEFCRKVRSELPSSLVVATDLHHATRYFHRLLRLGVPALCLKYNPFSLWQAVSAAAGGGQFIDESITSLIEQTHHHGTMISTKMQLDVLLRSKLDDEEIAEELGLRREDVEQTVAELSQSFAVNAREDLAVKAAACGFQPLPIDLKLDPETGISYEQTTSELLAETAIAQEHLRALITHLRLFQ